MRKWQIAFVVAPLLLATACFEPVFRIGQHTLQVDETKQTDVVWMVLGNTLQRCTAQAGGPVCTTASGIELKDRGRLVGIAQHTVRVSQSQQADVVWVVVDKGLFRCQGFGGAPVCAKVVEAGK